MKPVKRATAFLLIALGSAAAANMERLALELKAQNDFDRVEKALSPQLREAKSCIQSQAALLPVATREMSPVVQYRKGYCTLASAVITEHAGEFSSAAADLEKAMEAWPLRNPKIVKEEAPPDWKILASVARLRGRAEDAVMEGARQTLATTVASGKASPPVQRLGKVWLGRIELRADSLIAAARNLEGAERSGWTEWASGRKEFRDAQYREAADQYRKALDLWERAKQSSTRTLLEQLAPPPDMRSAYADLGGAQLLAGSLPEALASLSQLTEARAVFLRARAKELSGQNEAALADYSLASRTAFAVAEDLASGEAHLYRGILFYRRKEFTRAETEFSSALNFEIPAAFRGDAAAWRHMAAVASGSCDASRLNLEFALAAVSPYFPKEEARSLTTQCLITRR